jgi:hypothetical protein
MFAHVLPMVADALPTDDLPIFTNINQCLPF